MDVESLTRGQVVLEEAPDYGKTWLVVPVLAKVRTTTVKTDWEAQKAAWFSPADVPKLDLLPGFMRVFEQFFSR